MKRAATVILVSLVSLLAACACADDGPWRVAARRHTRIPRAKDVVVLQGGKRIVAAMGLGTNLLCLFDADTGAVLARRHARQSTPQCLVGTTGGVLLVHDVHGKAGRPRLTAFDTEFSPMSETALPDFRLYRVPSAALTPDGRRLWLSSWATDSSLYGHVNSALFRVDLAHGACSLVIGCTNAPTAGRRVPNLALPEPSERSWLLASAAGDVVASGISTNELLVFDGGGTNMEARIPLPFAPCAMPREAGRLLAVGGPSRIAVVDLALRRVVAELKVAGVPRAACTSSDGSRAFFSILGSNEVAQVDLPSGTLFPGIDLARQDGERGIADASRGYDVHDIVVLRWADDPPRLIGLGYDGYVLIVAELEKDGRPTVIREEEP